MNRRLSRLIGGVELVMLLVPVSMSAIGGLVILGHLGALQEELGTFMPILLYLALPVGVALAAIVALGRTLGAFVLVGPHALLEVSRVWCVELSDVAVLNEKLSVLSSRAYELAREMTR